MPGDMHLRPMNAWITWKSHEYLGRDSIDNWEKPLKISRWSENSELNRNLELFGSTYVSVIGLLIIAKDKKVTHCNIDGGNKDVSRGESRKMTWLSKKNGQLDTRGEDQFGPDDTHNMHRTIQP